MAVDTRPAIGALLEELYAAYNRREWVHPDPLEFLYDYESLRDREISGLISSSLAYGRVEQILKSVSFVLERMSPSPFSFLTKASPDALRRTFAGFKHRFTTAEELSMMLSAIGVVVRRRGSLHACFVAGLRDDSPTVLPALSAFADELAACGCGARSSLLPLPSRGSACKRLSLFLRWMVRHDEVDPGGWSSVPASKLVVPLDTHLHRICLALGMTARRQADIRTALEVTQGFRRLAPEDPVRYDFALTRLGIRRDADLSAFLARCGAPGL